jgi:hypothetical protein
LLSKASKERGCRLTTLWNWWQDKPSRNSVGSSEPGGRLTWGAPLPKRACAAASHHAHPGSGVLGMLNKEGRDSLFGQNSWETSSKSMRNEKNNQKYIFSPFHMKYQVSCYFMFYRINSSINHRPHARLRFGEIAQVMRIENNTLNHRWWRHCAGYLAHPFEKLVFFRRTDMPSSQHKDFRWIVLIKQMECPGSKKTLIGTRLTNGLPYKSRPASNIV